MITPKTLEDRLLVDLIHAHAEEIKKALVYALSRAAEDEKPAPFQTDPIFNLYCIVSQTG
jgi:hypothetical protein